METTEYKNHTIEILQDTDPMNPRTDYDNLGLIYAAHRRYNLGDKLADAPKDLFMLLYRLIKTVQFYPLAFTSL